MAGRLPLTAKLSSVLASMTTAPVIVGNTPANAMVCVPVPAMLKWMRSAPPAPLAVLLAAVIASRSEISPSAPRLAASAARDEVSASFTRLSLVVVTVISP